MNQFINIFRFEFLNTLKAKSFMVLTVLIALLIAGGLFYPGILEEIRGEQPETEPETSDFADKTIAVSTADQSQGVADFLAAALQCKTLAVSETQAQLEEKVKSGAYNYALLFTSPLEYKLITQNVSMIDTADRQLDSLILLQYRSETLARYGVSPQDSVALAGAATDYEVIATGNDNTKSFGYIYALTMLLYMSIMLYGQIVAQSVATEKSSRAMELLITSAKPSSLMFGKVFGVGCAGLLQMTVWISAALGAYSLNKASWADNATISGLFEGETEMLLYTLVFFLLGYFLYAFLYGALGSLASRLEDVNTLSMPVTLLVVFMFIVSLFSMIFGKTESLLLKVMSFVPLTAPMSMFVRILNNSAAPWEIALSLLLMVGGVVALGYLAAGIYRIGVLLYGKPPKLSELLKLLKKAN